MDIYCRLRIRRIQTNENINLIIVSNKPNDKFLKTYYTKGWTPTVSSWIRDERVLKIL